MAAQILDIDEEKLVRHFCLEAECKQVLEWFAGKGFKRPEEFAKRVKMADKLRELGNKDFQASNFSSAMMHALGAMHCVDFSQARAALHSEPQRADVLKALIPILSNLSVIFLKRGDAYNSVRAADLGIERVDRLEQLKPNQAEVKSQRAKLLFRRGLAKGQRKEFVDARADLHAAALLVPNDKEIRKALENCKTAVVEQRGSDDDKWRGTLTETPHLMRIRAKLQRCWRSTKTCTQEVVECFRQPGGLKTLSIVTLGPLVTFGLRYLVLAWADSGQGQAAGPAAAVGSESESGLQAGEL